MSWKGLEIILEAASGKHDKLTRLLGGECEWYRSLSESEYIDLFADFSLEWDNEFRMARWVENRWDSGRYGALEKDDLLVALPVLLNVLAEHNVISGFSLISRGWSSVDEGSFQNRLTSVRNEFKSKVRALKNFLKSSASRLEKKEVVA